MTSLTATATTVAAVGSATFGGVLYGFSAFVMRGLDRSPTRAAIQTMQQINLAAPRAPLVLVRVGTALACLVVAGLAVVALLRGEGRAASVLALLGCAGFLAAFVITGVYHVPHNDAFATVAADGPGAAAAWRSYADPWVLWNHVRTGAALVGALLLVLSLVV